MNPTSPGVSVYIPCASAWGPWGGHRRSLVPVDMHNEHMFTRGACQHKMDDAHLHRLEELRRVHLHLSGAHAARISPSACASAIGARRTSIHFRPFCFPSLHISERGASRSPSNVYVEFGSSCPMNAWVSKGAGLRRGKWRWRRLQRADQGGTHGDEIFQFLLWLRRSGILRSVREFVLQLLYERHGRGRKGFMGQAPVAPVGYPVGARYTMTSLSAVSQEVIHCEG